MAKKACMFKLGLCGTVVILANKEYISTTDLDQCDKMMTQT